MLIAFGIAIGVVGANWSPRRVADAGDTEVRVRADRLDGRLETQATFVPAETIDVRGSASGRVTAESCKVGTLTEEGAVVATIDGAPVIGLSTPNLLYRDVGPGAVGADVAELRSALARLGLGREGPRFYDADLGTSIDAFNTRFGVVTTPGVFLASSAARLPPGASTFRSCPFEIGQRVDVSDVLTTVSVLPDRVRIDGDLPQLLTGAPVTIDFLDGRQVDVASGANEYDDPAVVSGFLAAERPEDPSAPNAGGEPDAGAGSAALESQPVVLTLQDPTDVVVVPIGALRAQGNDRCEVVVTAPVRATVTVEVIALVAGTAYVRSGETQTIDRVRLARPGTFAPCR